MREIFFALTLMAVGLILYATVMLIVGPEKPKENK